MENEPTGPNGASAPTGIRRTARTAMSDAISFTRVLEREAGCKEKSAISVLFFEYCDQDSVSLLSVSWPRVVVGARSPGRANLVRIGKRVGVLDRVCVCDCVSACVRVL